MLIFTPILPEDIASIARIQIPTISHSTFRMSETVTRHPSLKLKIDGKIIAYAYTEILSPGVLVLKEVFVDNCHRGKKYGRKIVLELHKKAAELGYEYMIAAEGFADTAFLSQIGYSIYARTKKSLVLGCSLSKEENITAA